MKLMFYALMVFVTTVTLTFGGAHTEVRDGLIYYKDKPNQLYTGSIKSYFDNGKLKGSISIKNGQPTGLAEGWYNNGSKHYEYTQKNGIKNGNLKIYNLDGSLKTTQFFKNNIVEYYIDYQKASDSFRINALDYFPIFGKINYKYHNTEKTIFFNKHAKNESYKYTDTFVMLSCNKQRNSCNYESKQGVNTLNEIYTIENSGVFSYLKKLNSTVLSSDEFKNSRELILPNSLVSTDKKSYKKVKEIGLEDKKYKNCIEVDSNYTSHAKEVLFNYGANKLNTRSLKVFCSKVGLVYENTVTDYFFDTKHIAKHDLISVLS